jgi:superfamily I DNA/RNA helicase
MMTSIWPPDENNPPADNDQKVAAEAFRQNGKIVLEAPPGTGKPFLGIYLALCAYRLGWTSSDSPALFLTFSRNARVQIEQELQRYSHNCWFNADEERSIKIYNFHSFYFEIIQQKAGIWGCSVQLRPASILEHNNRLNTLLSDAQRDDKEIINQASLVFALNRFPIDELLDPSKHLLLDDATFERLNDGAKNELLQGRPQYDDFAPLFLNLLEICPEFVDWIRTKYPLIIVDEFQDTDIVQLEIIKKIHPAHFVILYDRYQMIYEWRGARLNRVEQIKSYLNIVPLQEHQLTQIHRCGNQVELAQFIQQLRTDELMGNNVTSNGNRPWLRTFNVRPLGGGIQLPIENRCLSRLRYAGMINFRETTAILTRTNFMADYLYEHLRVRSDHGNHYSCRWIGGEDNPDEKIRDLLWRLKQVNSNSELRSWLGTLLDLLLPQSILTGLKISFSSEFGREPDQIFSRRRRVEFQNILNSWNTILTRLQRGIIMQFHRV